MYPRWRSDQTGGPASPSPTAEQSLGRARADFFSEPLPDLEDQLLAELGGAAWATVAFAPPDAAWCDWLYRNLNGYPLPATLVDRVTPHGFPRPGCLSIFPDRQDPAYEEQVAHALETSAYLIVVCSPDSARAGAVDQQIRLFKNAGGEERIIALVVDGPPDADLGQSPRAPLCEWLPSWLRWRVEPDGFHAADRSEPRIIDARRGYRSLRQVRDGLLAALADMDAAEFERLGGCERPVEVLPLPEPPPPVTEAPEMTSAAIHAPHAPLDTVPRRGSRFTIFTAAILALFAIFFGARSFREITSDEPASTLPVGRVTGVLAGRATKVTHDAVMSSDKSFAPHTAEAAEQAVSQPAPPPTPPSAYASAVPTAPVGAPHAAAGFTYATSHIQPPGAASTVAAATTGAAPAAQVANPENDAVLLDEVRTLERRGDETMVEKRTEDALDLYKTALSSAQEYAARKGSSASARDQVFNLTRKLGTLQLQNSSTAEARATYMMARDTLLQLKRQGVWSRERAKALDEIESRILSLPRD